ncbi:hypothetical protein B0H12DRAFT_269159 [Mycena haematopus]|nr:hypothetical protein B0H12DRAFT_269159 [Mycena haematopus]
MPNSFLGFRPQSIRSRSRAVRAHSVLEHLSLSATHCTCLFLPLVMRMKARLNIQRLRMAQYICPKNGARNHDCIVTNSNKNKYKRKKWYRYFAGETIT